ncbi:MAG: TraB/GumN family protein [Kiritimatiellia bacterium]|jgi:pheromone shutdown-related protein TraB|nr:TraB/GumN family protein [Kiritimatiellia bacterium]
MQNTALSLPSSTTQVELEGKTVYIVGTAHVSAQSVQDVRDTVAAVQPDTIAIELCEPRYQGMKKKTAWRETNLFQVVKQGKATFLLAQLAMQSFYRRLGQQLEVEPGAEMMAGAACAEETGARLELIDRRIDITLKRVWRYLGIWQRLKLFATMAGALFSSEAIADADVEALKQQDQLEALMGEMGQAFPEIKKRLIDERDVYLAQKLRASSGQRIVAVVGAGHVPGMLKAIQHPLPLAELDLLPPKSRWSKMWPWLIPVAVVALIAWGFVHGGTQHGVDSILIWVGVNGILSALGAICVLAHPLTVVAAFVAAPLTSLNPTIAAGWVAGLVQAWVRPPSVGDFEALPQAMETLKGFFLNPVVRILLVVVAANLGSSIGTFVAIPWIAAW